MLSQQRFGKFAQSYVHHVNHAQGQDLERLLEMAKPGPDWLVLDVATGGGHTALTFAPYVSRVIASDLAPHMLKAARIFVDRPNVTYVAADAENLTFADNTFDLVTCRIAPHHFPDCFHFVQECVRIVKPDRWVLVQDHIVPGEDRAASYIDAFERLRDPSHNRSFSGCEWRGMFLDAGLSIERVELLSKPTRGLIRWAEVQDCPPEIIEKLQVMLLHAPGGVAQCIRPQNEGTLDADFDHVYILILGKKD